MTPTRAEFHVLLALLDGPRHGYGLMQDVEELSAGRLQIGPGTLYTAIKRLHAARLISETGADAERRRCYKLTRKGRDVAEEEAQRLNDLVRLARKRGVAGVDVMNAERIYARLLLIYPKPFREEFGADMLVDFSRLRRSKRDRPLAFWRFVVADVVRSAVRQHLERFRESRGRVVVRWLFVCLVGIATTGSVIDLFGWSFRYLYHPFLEGLDISAVACGYGLCLGAGLGITQSLALRYRWRLALAWMAVSSGAAALGLFVIASFAIMRQPLGFPESGIVLGGSVGVGQWMLVRVQAGYDRRWAFATVFVLATAAVTFGAAIQSTFAGVNPLSLAPLEAPLRPYRDLLDVVLGTLQQIHTWAVIAIAFVAMTVSGIVIGSLALKPVAEHHAH